MPFTRPTDLPEFASAATTSPDIAEPASEKKASGWSFQEKPNRGWLNWLHKTVYLWVAWFDQNIGAGLGTAAQANTGTTVGTVPLQSGTKMLDVDISGVTSAASDTGTVTNTNTRGVDNSTTSKAAVPDSQVNASVGSTIVASVAEHPCSEAQINASDGCGVNGAYGSRLQINASHDCTLVTAAGTSHQIDASDTCSIAGGTNVLIAASNQCGNDGGTYKMILASKNVKAGNSTDYTVCGGFNNSGSPASSNRKWQIDSQTGAFSSVLTAGASFVSSATFSDFGEYFENLNTGAIPLGTIVTLENGKVRPAKTDERICGVVSATTAFVGGDSDFHWQGRFLKGEFGEPLFEDIPDPEWVRPKGKAGKDAVAPTIRVQKENPEYDPSRESVPRSKRPEEWSCVGLLGKVLVRVLEDVTPGDYVGPDGRKSAIPTRLECMTIKQTYNSEAGYAVAFCLLV